MLLVRRCRFWKPLAVPGGLAETSQPQTSAAGLWEEAGLAFLQELSRSQSHRAREGAGLAGSSKPTAVTLPAE